MAYETHTTAIIVQKKQRPFPDDFGLRSRAVIQKPLQTKSDTSIVARGSGTPRDSVPRRQNGIIDRWFSRRGVAYHVPFRIRIA